MDDQIFDNQTRSQMPVEFKPEPAWKLWLQKHGKTYGLSALAVIVLGIGGWFGYVKFFAEKAPSVPNIVLLIKGPSQITSGNEGEYEITYRNGENADMVAVSMEVFYPSGFKF